jgi:hypothetical protein
MFNLEQPLEELLETQFVASSLVGDVGQMRRHRAQSQPIAEIADFVQVNHNAISRAKSSYVESGCCSDSTGVGIVTGSVEVALS